MGSALLGLGLTSFGKFSGLQSRVGTQIQKSGSQEAAMKVHDSSYHVGVKPPRIPSLPVINFPDLGEKPVQDVVEFSFPVDHPESCQLADQKMCERDRVPGLVRGLETSKSSPLPFPKRVSELLDTGLEIAGPAVGLPGIASLHFVRGQKGIEFYALDSHQKRVPLKGRVTECYPGLELQLGKERKVEIGTNTRYPAVHDERNGYYPVHSSYGIEVKSSVRYSGPGVLDCLKTSFDSQGKAVEASYERKMPDYRTASVSLERASNGARICLSQGGGGDIPSQNLTVTRYQMENKKTYRSPYDNYPF